MEFRYPWDSDSPPARTPPDLGLSPKPRGRRPGIPSAAGWRYHHLTVTGSAEPVAAFAEAARGSGIIPWQLDLATLEEDVFNLAAAQPAATRNLTIVGCRILARQFRERVEVRQAKAVAQVGSSRACPFDLHVLLPVPPAILRLGPTHETARAWLADNWGVTDQLRQVVAREHPTAGRRLPAGHTVVGYGFFTMAETPQAAITQIAARWPALRFVLQPRP
jgi:hypothetical protein